MTRTAFRTRFLYGLLLGGASVGSAHGGAAPIDTSNEIVVAAPRGTVTGGIGPLLNLSPDELDSYGTDTLTDLVDALRPLTRSSRSDQQAVVLINGHLAGQTEFDNLPREAVERVEVLPESVALQYGFSENQRVLNFILKEHYRAIPLRASDSGATEGGSQIASADASLVRLDDEARVSLLASEKKSAWLRESDRGIDLPASVARTLQPEKNDAKIAGTISRSLFGVSTSLEASYAASSVNTLQGAAENGQSLGQSAPLRTTRVAAQLTGQWLRFVWGATAYYVHTAARSSSAVGVDGNDDLSIDRTRSGLDVGNLQISASGRVASLPAGAVIANLKFALQYQGFTTQIEDPGTATPRSNLVRTVHSGSLNAAVPVASRDAGVLPMLGDMAMTFNAALDDVSDYGSLLSISDGFEWKPLSTVHLDAIYTDHRSAPTVQQLRAPPILTPNTEIYDFITGRTALVAQITGGNPQLASSDARQTTLGVSLGPYLGKTTFVAHYERIRVHNAIGQLPPTTADVELAFPERFTRDAEGDLVDVDDRWVNLRNQSIDDLKWGVNIWVPLGDSAPHAMANRVEMSLFDTWYLHDVTLVRDGIPTLDLLNGAPSDISGGQPRHKIEFHTLYHRNGFGVLLAATWHSATSVGSGESLTPSMLNFSALGTADLRIFSDLERLPITRQQPWARGARLSLAVTNLADRRQSVTDPSGRTPAAFLPGYLDPPGRTLAINIRKVF
jgi:hypothetical protein